MQNQIIKDRPSTTTMNFTQKQPKEVIPKEQQPPNRKTIVGRIKHTKESIKNGLLDPNYREQMSLLFYDFNSYA